MKQFTFSALKSALLLLGSSAVMAVSAQTARVQLLHNAAAVSLDTVDVYVGGTKFDNVPFRYATPLQTIPSGSYKINVNQRNSADSGDQVLARFTVTLAASSSSIVMIAGVDAPGAYAANPDGKATDLRIVTLPSVGLTVTDASKVALSFANGTTDAAAMTLKFRSGATLVNLAKFGDISTFSSTPANTLFGPTAPSLLDITDAGNNPITSLITSFSAYSKKSLFLFTSGFANPAANQNGAAWGLFAVDTTGGMAMPINTTGARLQLLNNSFDPGADSLDVWLNTIKVASNLGYAKMAPILTVPTGTYDITFSRRNSVDTSLNALSKIYGFNIATGQSYLAMATGVIDTTVYATNPQGLDRTIMIKASNAYRETAVNTGQVDIAFYNGSPDAPALDVIRLGTSSLKISNDKAYGDNSFTYVSMVTGKYLVALTNSDSTRFYGTYVLNLNGMAGKAGILFTSGVFDSTMNPASSRKFKVFIGYGDGTVQELVALKSGLQIVHNSADSLYNVIDVYLNGSKVLDNLAFRKGSPFLPLTPYAPYTIAVAPQNSTSAADAFFTKNITTDSTNMYAVIAGYRDTTGHTNPEGRPTNYNIYTFRNAKVKSDNPKNIDLLYFHGAPDLGTTTMLGYNGAMYISKNDPYGTFHPIYSYNPALDNLDFELKNAATDTVLTKKAVGNISVRKGQAGLIFASGLNKNLVKLMASQDTSKHIVLDSVERLRALGLYIIWPDGKTDTIEPAVGVGINEVMADRFHASFYPNPATDKLHVSFELKGAAHVEARLFDLNGKEVAAAPKTQMNSGKNELSFTIGDLVNGIYFCALDINGQQVISKISVMK